MHSIRLWTATGLLLLTVTASGCASKLAPVQCPKFQPSPEALAPIQGTGWRQMGDRVVEHFRDGKTISPPP